MKSNKVQKSLETRRFYKRIFKGGNFDFFCENLDDLIFNKLNLKSSKTNLDMFLTNYIAMICDELDIDYVDVYFNFNTRVNNEPLAFVDHQNYVNLPSNILTSFKDNVFKDLVLIAHELKHVKTEIENNSITRKIGSNSGEYIFGTSFNILEKLGFTEQERSVFYVFNKNEILSNNFSYNYVLALIEKIKQNQNLEINKTSVLDVFKLGIEKDYDTIKKMWENGEEVFNLVLIPKLYSKQEKCANKIILSMKNVLKYFNNHQLYEQYFKESIFMMATFFGSLNIQHNQHAVDKLRNFAEKNFYSTPGTIILFKQILNLKNYVASKEDLNLLIKTHKYFDITLDFETIDIDRKNLIENYIDCAVDFENACFTKEEFVNQTNINKIKNNHILETELLKFQSQKIQEHVKKNNDIEKNF